MAEYDLLHFYDEVHREHATETQIPFIQHYLPHLSVVEIIYGEIAYTALASILEKILNTPKTLLVISTDLSHFHPLKEASRLDAICLDGIKKLDVNRLEQGCEACGITGVKALISLAKESQVVDYRTSYDASGDAQQVVGYLSALVR